MKNNVIQLPPVWADRAEYFRLLPEAARAMAEMSYWGGQTERLYEVCRPYEKGWVSSREACFHRRTKSEFLRMFQINQGKPAIDLLGFRDEAEGMVCNEAAIEAGSDWRFQDFYNKYQYRWGGGLGNLNEALAEYAEAFIPGLFTNEFPVPPPTEQEVAHDNI